MQKKWVELFEKVIGRKPSPEEFMAGKACGFDLKQIQLSQEIPQQRKSLLMRNQWLNQLKK